MLSQPRKGSPGEQIPGILAAWPSPGGVGRTPWGGREARVGRWKLDLFPETWQDKEKKLKKISFWTRFPSVFGVSAPRPQNEAQGRLRKEGSVFKPPKREFGQSREQQPPNRGRAEFQIPLFPPETPPSTGISSEIPIFCHSAHDIRGKFGVFFREFRVWWGGLTRTAPTSSVFREQAPGLGSLKPSRHGAQPHNDREY